MVAQNYGTNDVLLDPLLAEIESDARAPADGRLRTEVELSQDQVTGEA